VGPDILDGLVERGANAMLIDLSSENRIGEALKKHEDGLQRAASCSILVFERVHWNAGTKDLAGEHKFPIVPKAKKVVCSVEQCALFQHGL
jgi:hypothetical protein